VTLISNGQVFGDLVLLNGTKTVNVSGALSVGGSLDIGANQTLAAGGNDILLGGNWDQRGHLRLRRRNPESRVHRRRADIRDKRRHHVQQLRVHNSEQGLTFTAGSTQTIANSFTINGQATGTRITLQSSSGGSAWNLAADDGAGTYSVANATVQGFQHRRCVRHGHRPGGIPQPGRERRGCCGGLLEFPRGGLDRNDRFSLGNRPPAAASGNWSTGIVPDPSDKVTIPDAGTTPNDPVWAPPPRSSA
jgi:hypothetical protein